MYLQVLPLCMSLQSKAKDCESALDLEKGYSLQKVETAPIKVEGLNEGVF